jgi:hypothetical protein
MSLDFNTLEVQNNNKALVEVSEATEAKDGAEEGNKSSSHRGVLRFMIPTLIFMGLCTLLSLSSLVLSLTTIKNIPKPEPVSIECDPNLLKKIEKQAQVLEEIAKSSKIKK